MDTNLFCKKCGAPRNKGRRLCETCASLDAVERAQRSRARIGRKKFEHTCLLCHGLFFTFRKTSKFCSTCLRDAKNTRRQNNSNYEYSDVSHGRLVWKHREMAENILQRRLMSHEVVHHIDCDKSNNSPENLMVLSRSQHVRLHYYLGRQRILLENYIQDGKNQDCWEAFILPMTMLWLKTANVKAVVLSEVM